MHTVNSRVLSALMPGTGALGASASTQLAGNVRNELRRADAAAAAVPVHGRDRKVGGHALAACTCNAAGRCAVSHPCAVLHHCAVSHPWQNEQQVALERAVCKRALKASGVGAAR